MAIELKMLGVAVIIGLVHLIWAASAAQPQRGLTWNIGPRDTPVILTGMAARLERAFTNFRETFPLFAAAILAAYLAGKLGTLTEWGSILYVAGRALYIPLYAFGVPVVRSVAWFASLIGIILVLVALFQ